jgi:hypothetical protein
LFSFYSRFVNGQNENTEIGNACIAQLLCFYRRDNEAGRESPMDTSKLGVGIAIGIAVGAGFGVALDNIALGIGFGIAIGVAIGIALSSGKSDPPD